ncbi:DUF924 domain-containing protein [Alishewanella sp. 16-MA]|uniref:DUF924 domain-containing protein n=1 Tax=Alishewanella maricola TaxID=2795740 RepID=A0ABS8C399_9ALTE|nr:DUF924 domain-containing protein [Alishewanella maricola]
MSLSLNPVVLKFERVHYDIMLRFGRYLYRNAMLGQTSTAYNGLLCSNRAALFFENWANDKLL